MVTADDHLPHLHPAVQATARLSASERIDQIRADRWIGYPKASRPWTGCKPCSGGHGSSACRICC